MSVLQSRSASLKGQGFARNSQHLALMRGDICPMDFSGCRQATNHGERNDMSVTATGEIRLAAFSSMNSDSPAPDSQDPKTSYDDIALRAYFIALDRHRRGEPADPSRDWLEAERQLGEATKRVLG
jgi:hypothetical protein